MLEPADMPLYRDGAVLTMLQTVPEEHRPRRHYKDHLVQDYARSTNTCHSINGPMLRNFHYIYQQRKTSHIVYDYMQVRGSLRGRFTQNSFGGTPVDIAIVWDKKPILVIDVGTGTNTAPEAIHVYSERDPNFPDNLIRPYCFLNKKGAGERFHELDRRTFILGNWEPVDPPPDPPPADENLGIPDTWAYQLDYYVDIRGLITSFNDGQDLNDGVGRMMSTGAIYLIVSGESDDEYVAVTEFFIRFYYYDLSEVHEAINRYGVKQ